MIFQKVFLSDDLHFWSKNLSFLRFREQHTWVYFLGVGTADQSAEIAGVVDDHSLF